MQKIDFRGGSGNQISHKVQISSEFPELPTIIVNSDDSPIRKRKDLNVGSFDGPFLSMAFHFLAANTVLRAACPLLLFLMLAIAFFDCYLSIVSGH
jgi:hypothetical protein